MIAAIARSGAGRPLLLVIFFALTTRPFSPTKVITHLIDECFLYKPHWFAVSMSPQVAYHSEKPQCSDGGDQLILSLITILVYLQASVQTLQLCIPAVGDDSDEGHSLFEKLVCTF